MEYFTDQIAASSLGILFIVKVCVLSVIFQLSLGVYLDKLTCWQMIISTYGYSPVRLESPGFAY